MAGSVRGIRIAAAIGIIAGAAAALVWAVAPGRPDRPNIVLLVWDTCRADRLSAYGYSKPTTPWLEEFARDAVLYREAFSPSPWTPPAHASLFTGLLPENHHLRNGGEDRVRRGVPLLAETLRASGYETIGFSCNAFVSPSTGLSEGFERMTPLYGGDRGAGTAVRVEEGIAAWLRARRAAPPAGRERPLFLFVNFMDCHLPRRPPAEDIAAVTGSPHVDAAVSRAVSIDQLQANAHLYGIRAIDPDTLAGMSVVYDAAAHYLDRMTGRVVGMLDDEGLLEDAMVVITSDHGEHLGEHGLLSHQLSLYDPVQRIPLVARWPGRLEGGRIERAQVRLQDLHPTLLEAAGVRPPPGTALDAVSLLEEPLRARLHRAQFFRPLPFLAEAMRQFEGAPASAFDRFQVTIRSAQEPSLAPGARKLLRYLRRTVAGDETVAREELFDLAADPREERNLLLDPSPEDRAAAERLRAK